MNPTYMTEEEQQQQQLPRRAVIAVEVDCWYGDAEEKFKTDHLLAIGEKGEGYQVVGISDTRISLATEYAVERESGLEIGASAGTSAYYDFTDDNIRELAEWDPIYTRTRATFADAVTDWVPLDGKPTEERP